MIIRHRAVFHKDKYPSFSANCGSLHDHAVEMPTRMCEDRHDKRQANESQQKADHEGCGDD
jgi:hypothetical protein